MVDARGLLTVDQHAISAQQDVLTAITEPPPLVGQLAQLLAKLGVIVPRGTVTHALMIGIDDTACPPLAHPLAVLKKSNSLPLRDGR
ncbi:hypothetical protein A3711_02785 [Erythrobacter sp. HI00D59]|nr:hypothetical protein A3711_02785 [Erythrobacter sp. HI00D59]